MPPLLVVVDAPMLVFRALFGRADAFFDPDGRSVNAVVGFVADLRRLLASAPQARWLFCWDESLGRGFRHRLYPLYKANRPPADEALLHQFALCRDLLRALGIAQLGSEEFEADDLMASAVSRQRRSGGEAWVVSRDKDLAQLIGPQERLWRYPQRGLLTSADLESEWGCPVVRIADCLALAGDSSDNIPGVRGVGMVTARRLMAHYESLTHLLESPDDMLHLGLRGAARLRDRLLEHREALWQWRALTALRDDAMTDDAWASLCAAPSWDESALAHWRNRVGHIPGIEALRVMEGRG